MPRLSIPVIGIGAGPRTDGQVLVFHDIIGLYDGHAARFVKRYADLRTEMVTAVTSYTDEVRTRRLPAARTRLRHAPRRGRAAARTPRRR